MEVREAGPELGERAPSKFSREEGEAGREGQGDREPPSRQSRVSYLQSYLPMINSILLSRGEGRSLGRYIMGRGSASSGEYLG